MFISEEAKFASHVFHMICLQIKFNEEKDQQHFYFEIYNLSEKHYSLFT